MAYIVSTTQTATAVAATYTVTLGSHQSGDLLLVKLSQDGGGTAIAPDATATTAGWAMIGTQAASGVSRSAWAFLIADSASEVNPTFTGANDDWIGTCVVVRDAHATAPFGSLVSGTDFVRSDWNNVSSAASGAVTTAVDECLILYSWNSDGNLQYMRAGFADGFEVDKYATAAINHIISARQQQTAGAAPTATMYNINATEGGNGWVLAIRNKSGGALQSDVRVTGSELKFYGPWSATHDAITWQSPDQFSASINSISCGTTVPTVGAPNFWSEEPWGQFSSITTGNSTSGEWSGGTHAISSTDMSGKFFSVQLAMTAASSAAQHGTGGALIGFSDGTNWIAYQIQTREKGWPAGSPERYVIALGNATVYASSGSINWAAVTRIAYFYHRAGSTTTAGGVQIKNATLVSALALTGGGKSSPLTLRDIALVNGFSQYHHAVIQSSSQIQIRYPLQIGDGTNTTFFDGAAQSVEFPQAWSATKNNNWQMFWNAVANTAGLLVKAGASDTISLASGVAATDTQQAFTVDSASSTSATYNFAQSFVGWAPVLKTGIAFSGATFKECGEIAGAGASLTNCTIAKTTSTDAAISITANGSTLTSTTIDVTGTGAAYHLELGTGVTSHTLADVTFTGTPSTDKVHVLATTGTVTITISGTTSLAAADVTSAGATVVISAPQLYQSVTISNITTTSCVQIYDTSATPPVGSRELYKGVPGATSITWTDSLAAVASRSIRVRIADVTGTTARDFIEANIGTCGVTSGTQSVSYLANQTADTTYNTNAVNGSLVTGITFTDAATDLVNVNLAGGNTTWQNIYAAFAYWISTAAGIDDDIAYVDAVDPANYLLTSMKIKNTSSPSVPLTITGGFGRDATTGSIADIIDTTGGNIYPLVDHVVTVGGANVITGDIADIPSAPTVPQIVAGVVADPATLTVKKFLALGD